MPRAFRRPTSPAHNAALQTRQKPEAVAARERELLGIDDPDYRPSMELNDLVDWHTIHADLTARTTAERLALVAVAAFEFEDAGFDFDAVLVVVQAAFAVDDAVARIE